MFVFSLKTLKKNKAIKCLFKTKYTKSKMERKTSRHLFCQFRLTRFFCGFFFFFFADLSDICFVSRKQFQSTHKINALFLLWIGQSRITPTFADLYETYTVKTAWTDIFFQEITPCQHMGERVHWFALLQNDNDKKQLRLLFWSYKRSLLGEQKHPHDNIEKKYNYD